MNNDKEIKIYEALGVNFFRKKILFTWEKIAKFAHLPIGYRIDEYSIDGFKEYLIRATCFGVAHAGLLIFILINYLFSNASIGAHIFNILFNGYCIMTQRYNYIRISKMIERIQKHENRIKMKKEEKDKEEDSLANENEKELHTEIKKPTYVTIKRFDEPDDSIIEEPSRVLKKRL